MAFHSSFFHPDSPFSHWTNNSSPARPSARHTMSAQALSATGRIKVRLKRSGRVVGRASGATASLTSLPSSVSSLPTKRKLDVAFVTPVSAPPISSPTSSDNVQTFSASAPATKSSTTLAAASTGSGRACLPFWTPSVQALSRKLWLPTVTGLHASVWNSWNGSSGDTIQNSWFSTTLHRNPVPTSCVTTYSPSLLSSWLATTEGGPPQIASDAGPPPTKKAKTKKSDKPSAGKAKKIRVYPNSRQRILLRQWFGTARWVYNQCLDLVRADRSKRTKKELRAAIVNNNSPMAVAHPWLLETPYEVRDAAMVQVIDAYATNFAKHSKNPTHRFEIKYRSRKSPQETIVVRGKAYNKGVFYRTFFGTEPLRSSEPLPDAVNYDCKLTYTRLGHYYLCIPMPLAPASDSQARHQDRVVALDPGVRTFQTAYDPSGVVIEFGKADIGHIYRICTHMDKLQSRIDKNDGLTHKARYRMRRAWRKMQWHVRNLVDECHKKMVKFLCVNYSVILLPSFETQQMAIRAQRKIGSKTARAMMTWSHYRFKQRLLFKRQEYPWCKVVICDEAYTSKTCGACGTLKHTLRGQKTFKCRVCHVVIDRDINAARNILLKNSSLFGFAAKETLGLTPFPSQS